MSKFIENSVQRHKSVGGGLRRVLPYLIFLSTITYNADPEWNIIEVEGNNFETVNNTVIVNRRGTAAVRQKRPKGKRSLGIIFTDQTELYRARGTRIDRQDTAIIVVGGSFPITLTSGETKPITTDKGVVLGTASYVAD